MFLVSCAPKVSDEQLEKDLSKLSPEEQSALLKQAQSGNAVAGNAIASKYGASDKKQLVRILSEIRAKQQLGYVCIDSDGDNPYVKGTITGYYYNVSHPESEKPDPVIFTDFCMPESAYYNKVDFCANCGVVEHFCKKMEIPNWPSPIKKYIGTIQVVPDGKTVVCPKGCSNGACIK